MAYKNLLVGQSGGPSVAINASLMGVLTEGISSAGVGKVYGARNGIAGVLADQIIDMGMLEDPNQQELLKATPAMALGSCRYKLADPDADDQDFKRIEAIFQKYEIGYFFYIGGNDSMDTVAKLNRFFTGRNLDIRIIGVPKTIDNDLVLTDHTPGFGSAAKYLAVTVGEIIRDIVIYPVKSVTIIEIMGRDSGWLTLASALPRLLGGDKPDIVALPENVFDEDAFLDEINRRFADSSHIIAVVSEGIRDKDGAYVGSIVKGDGVDSFGHKQLAGVGKYLELLVKERIGCKVRSVEVNILQRAAAHLASKTDLDEAELIGREAVRLALEGKSGQMMAFERVSNHPYQVKAVSFPVAEVANAARMVPEEMRNIDDPLCREKAREYLLPLIQGEVLQQRDENGLPKYFIL